MTTIQQGEKISFTEEALNSRNPSQTVFRSNKTRRGKALSFLLVTIFWNGIVAIPFVSAKGSLSFFLYLFLVPFVLVGIFLIIGTITSILALANPSFETHISLPLKMGERSSLQWKLDGKVERIEELIFALEGKEEVRYQRGTSTSTDSRVFQTIEIARLKRGGIMQKNGNATVEIPEITAPSFSAPNNSICWYLKIKGVVPKWPDIDDEYPVTVVLKPL